MEQPSPSEAFAIIDPKVCLWVDRFLEGLAVIRSANTVRAYRHDLTRWTASCAQLGIDPVAARPRAAINALRQCVAAADAPWV